MLKAAYHGLKNIQFLIDFPDGGGIMIVITNWLGVDLRVFGGFKPRGSSSSVIRNADAS